MTLRTIAVPTIIKSNAYTFLKKEMNITYYLCCHTLVVNIYFLNKELSNLDLCHLIYIKPNCQIHVQIQIYLFYHKIGTVMMTLG